ncbi:MAG: flagellar hook-length control protein FliK, partial [Proteobacteria bacterium]|nr:flagellar hook-length control protein FliK [Pseudomonadota bacterium]
ALARLALSQAASIPGRATGAAWRFDLPVATPAGPGAGQFEISRDGGRGGADAAAPTWRARFSLDIEPGGPVHVEVSLSGGRTRVTLWAEREGALNDLEAGAAELVAALAGPQGADAAVRVLPGAPPPTAHPGDVDLSPGHILDRTS